MKSPLARTGLHGNDSLDAVLAFESVNLVLDVFCFHVRMMSVIAFLPLRIGTCGISLVGIHGQPCSPSKADRNKRLSSSSGRVVFWRVLQSRTKHLKTLFRYTLGTSRYRVCFWERATHDQEPSFVSAWGSGPQIALRSRNGHTRRPVCRL